MYFVYILASSRNGTLYIGSTSQLIQRVWQHKHNVVEGFTKKYKVHVLVYYEEVETALGRVTRERQIKKWKREWKIKLIEKNNAEWNDLFETL